jgi:outer membrane protein OmpA-like peptidoglycan-associated protein/Tol biopolymer transport system component
MKHSIKIVILLIFLGTGFTYAQDTDRAKEKLEKQAKKEEAKTAKEAEKMAKAKAKQDAKAAKEVAKNSAQQTKNATKGLTGAETRANRDFENYAYMDAREAYLKVVDGGHRSVEILSRLGDSYYFNADLVNAEKWYSALFSYSEDIDAEYLHRYAQSLKAVGKYDTADRIMTKLNEVRATDDRGALFTAEQNYLNLIELQSGRFELSPVSFNSDLIDFAPAFNGAEVVFASNRNRRAASQRVHEWNDQPFTELYSVLISENAAPKRFKNSSKRINTKYHESTAAFTKDGQTMYFTRNNYTDGKAKADSKDINRLKLYKSQRTDKGWGAATELPFNNDQYSVAHPALSPDGKWLYFASGAPDGEGQSDLYRVEIKDGSYGDPESLGDLINTEGRETFPFISSDNSLYFASDGHVGLGGLDIYVAAINEDNTIGDIYNIGRPVNSPKDDLTFVINSTTGLGYFASNRDGGMGEDDIYSFEQTTTLIRTCRQMLSGEVRDKNTDDLIADAKVILLDGDNNVLEETQSDNSGAFAFSVLECSKGYAIRASKDGFSVAEKSFTTTAEYEAEVKKTLYLTPDPEEDLEIINAQVGQDLGQLLNLNPIYFDLSESYIRPDAQLELLKIVDAMSRFPNLKVDIRSHTDSRSSDSFNARLSEARAQSTRTYLVDRGIDASRLTARGYGESQLLNRCDNGVTCSEEEHQLNRRSEFIIVAR